MPPSQVLKEKINFFFKKKNYDGILGKEKRKRKKEVRMIELQHFGSLRRSSVMF
jgi:hypothetical protein